MNILKHKKYYDIEYLFNGEKWRPIKDYKGYYISNYGRVLSNKTILRCGHIYVLRKKILRPAKSVYYFLDLSKNNKSKMFLIHRLVGFAFSDNLLNKPCINHIDFDKGNNHISNLEWVTYKDNSEHAKINGRMPVGEENTRSKLKEKDIIAIRAIHSIGRSQYEIAKWYEVAQSTIGKVVNNKTWKHI